MKKLFSILAIVLLIFVFAVAVDAQRPEGRTFSLPEKAKKVSDNIYYLGKAKDVDGRVVEGYAILKRRDGDAKPPWAGGGKGKENKCYNFLAKGAKWKVEEDYMVDASGSGINSSFVSSNLVSDISDWESAAGKNNILGSEIPGDVDGADLVAPDNQNEVMFASAKPGTIAVTIVWGIFGGPPSNRELVEWDQVYNTYYNWSENAGGSETEMDFWNIAIHELGHTFGLGDLYDAGCSEATMYGYAGFGEVNKRTLELGDTTGIAELYK